MNRIILPLLLAIVIQPTVAQEQIYRGPTTHNGFVKAGDYLEMPNAEQMGYVMGLLDGFYSAPYFGAPENDKVLLTVASCVEGMKASQVVAIIEKRLKDHPEFWHTDLKNEGYQAMFEACHVLDFVPKPEDRHITPMQPDSAR
jgi:hypothetical protein